MKGFVTGGQAFDEFLGAGQPGRPHDLLERRIGLGGGDGVADRAAEQEILLQHDTKARTQMIHIDLAQIVAVDLDQPLIIAVQRLEQSGHRGFARPAAADDAKDRPFGNAEGDAIERRRDGARIAEGHLVEFDPADKRGADAPTRAPFLRREVDDAGDSGNRTAGFIDLHDRLCGLDHRRGHSLGHDHEGEDRAEIHQIMTDE